MPFSCKCTLFCEFRKQKLHKTSPDYVDLTLQGRRSPKITSVQEDNTRGLVEDGRGAFRVKDSVIVVQR